MKNKIYIAVFSVIILISNFNTSLAEENLLTLKQQLDRLQREVTDISKLIFNNPNKINEISNNNQTINFAAIDMRIYDLEKDIKNLNMNIEELIFSLDEINDKIKYIEEDFNFKLSNIKINNEDINKLNQSDKNITDNVSEENTLGTLKISTDIPTDTIENNSKSLKLNDNNENFIENNDISNLSPEDQFQSAFDQIRKKEYEKAKLLLRNFIKNNESNQLAGSAHYWLGELFLLEKNNIEAALVLAEGYQNYPESIKAPDMLYKLSQALLEIGKKQEACNTLIKLSKDFSSHKLNKKSEIKKAEINCDNLSQ